MKKNNIIRLIILIISTYIILKLVKELSNIVIKVFTNYPEISVAFITGILALISIPIGKYMENRYNTNINIKEKKSKVYLEFLNWLIDNIIIGNISKTTKLNEEIIKYQKDLTIYGSDKVLKSWIILRKRIIEREKIRKKLPKSEQIKYYIEKESIYIEKLILAIRKELGYKNKNFNRYDILRMYISNLDEFLT